MAISLLKDTQVFQADTEQEAQQLIEDCTKAQYTKGYKLTNSGSKYKNKKVKGEIVSEWYEVTLTRSYDTE